MAFYLKKLTPKQREQFAQKQIENLRGCYPPRPAPEKQSEVPRAAGEILYIVRQPDATLRPGRRCCHSAGS